MKISKELQESFDAADDETRKKLTELIEDIDRALCSHGISTHDLILCQDDNEADLSASITGKE